MSLPTKPSPLIAVLAGIALGMVCSVPIAAYLASWFGDTYNTRVWIYGGLLLWCIFGAVYVFRFAMKTTPKPLSLTSPSVVYILVVVATTLALYFTEKVTSQQYFHSKKLQSFSCYLLEREKSIVSICSPRCFFT